MTIYDQTSWRPTIEIGTPFPVSGSVSNVLPVAVTPPAGNMMTRVEIQNLSTTDSLYISYDYSPTTYEEIPALGVHKMTGTIFYFWLLGGAASVSYKGFVNVVRI